MEWFCELFRQLDETTKTNRKIAAMKDYFVSADQADAAWAVYVLTGRRMKRLIPTKLLREWAAEAANVPSWMFEECYERVGDLAETMALLVPGTESSFKESLASCFESRILQLGKRDDDQKKARLLETWGQLTPWQRFVFNKLITGALRVGVSQKLVVRALAEATGINAADIAHRLMGEWEPTADFYASLTSPDTTDTKLSRPYPFCLAHALEEEPSSLGELDDWFAEWKWDGIRAQLIRRDGEYFLWSRGEERLDERFPELAEIIGQLPENIVLDGEIVGWKEGHVLPFADLQRRIGRKKLGPKILNDVPARFIAFDILEREGADLRQSDFATRRRMLEATLAGYDNGFPLMLAPEVRAETWEQLAWQRRDSRALRVEGLMLKRKKAEYGVGRVTGLWWKWKIEPYTVDAVMIYAQRGHGRRASLYTDYTFAVWNDDGALIPFAKAYSGLTDEEIRKVDRFVRQHTLERFGPVRSVEPKLVFELAFENIQHSSRHKSGIAVRFPRIARWREDKTPDQADTLATIHNMLAATESERKIAAEATA